MLRLVTDPSASWSHYFLPSGGIVIWSDRKKANEITVSVSRGAA